jgi:hypothetical protein
VPPEGFPWPVLAVERSPPGPGIPAILMSKLFIKNNMHIVMQMIGGLAFASANRILLLIFRENIPKIEF